MSNTCFSTYKVTGDRNEVYNLYETIKKLDDLDIPLVKNNWYHSKLWLGCLVKALKGDPNKIYCRGTITSYEFDNDVLTIITETAWEEMAKTRHFIETCFPKIKIFYMEEEYGCERFYTNDADGQFFKERYFLDACDKSTYFETLNEASIYVENIVNHKVKATILAIKNALSIYNKENDDDFSFYEFKVVHD